MNSNLRAFEILMPTSDGVRTKPVDATHFEIDQHGMLGLFAMSSFDHAAVAQGRMVASFCALHWSAVIEHERGWEPGK